MDVFDRLKRVPPRLIVEGIVEGFHSNLDGWNPREKKVISRYIEDILLYAETEDSLEKGRNDINEM